MSENVTQLPRNDHHTLSVLWREIHDRADKAFLTYARNGDADGMAVSADLRRTASDRLKGLEKVK